MMRTPLCDVLGIDVPVICAPFGPWEQVELAAAVCEAGGLGSLGTAVTPLPVLRDQWARLRGLTGRPFAINHTMRPLDRDAFEATLTERPAVISFHIGDPGDLVARAHDAGIRWMQQVFDLDQARRAVDLGVDVIVAQGGEAGGNGGQVSTMVIVPAVVDIAGDIPVVAAGGIADGRGLAAALALGAQGISLGTRFLASAEASVAASWKESLVAADATDAVKADFADAVLPPLSPGGYRAVPRVLRTPFVDRWNADPDGAAAASGRLRGEILDAIGAGRLHEYLPFAGQSAALVHDVAPVREIIDRMVMQASAALDGARRSLAS
ncbi:NAD(P)H-dependent flavin oxidoreductase [Jiangella asiatica]|uniref:Nitronate monooxygenase n=1 Tax=Jiangella asiatica TaxID=2530372 RepID=A0A4R5CQK0_9ACTN|nr:nitronate monooxygenase [Jiangella asiatica]TDE02426.1 nitronate monooxygenase [Jiangella asiatica]